MVSLSRRRLLHGTAVAAGIGLAGCLEGATETRWPLFRGPSNNEASTRERPDGSLTVGWDLEYRSALESAPGPVTPSSTVADADRAYLTCQVTGEDDRATATGVIAFDPADGGVEWTRLIEHTPPVSTPIVPPPVRARQDLVVIAGNEAIVLAPASGRTRLRIALPWAPHAAPGGDRELVALAGPSLAMLDIEEAEDVRWMLENPPRPAPLYNPLTVLQDRVFLNTEGRVYAIRRGDGRRLWDAPLPEGAPTGASPLVDGYHLFLRIRREDGSEAIYAQDRANREHRWDHDLGPSPGEPAGMSAYRVGGLYSTTANELIATHVGNGSINWRRDLSVTTRYPTVGSNTIFCLGADRLVGVDRTDGEQTELVELPGSAPPDPIEPVPRNEAVLVPRSDRLLGITAGD